MAKKKNTKSNPPAPKPYNRDAAIINGNAPEKLFGINEAILAGQAANLPLYSERERGLAAAYAKLNEPANEVSEG